MNANKIKIMGYPVKPGETFQFKAGKRRIEFIDISNDPISGVTYVYVNFKAQEPKL